MKRLITTTLLSLLTVLAMSSPVSAVERWKFQMFNPAATSNRTLNIEYKVLSINATDDFAVTLYQNGVAVAAQAVTTDYGDSGVFTVNLPASGTYEYKTVADNSNDAVNKEETRTVQITNAPEPTVVTVNNGGAAAATTAAAAATETNGAAGANGTTETGADGQVSEDAASTDKQNDNQDVLGAETKDQEDKANNRRRNWYAAGILAVIAAGAAAYYLLVVRRSDA